VHVKAVGSLSPMD